MNEEVLLDLFNRAVSLGYNQTVEDFTELIKTNPDVLRDNYDYVVGQGYERSLEDFEILIGAKQPVKKKTKTKIFDLFQNFFQKILPSSPRSLKAVKSLLFFHVQKK